MTKEKLNSEVEALLPKSKPCKKCKQGYGSDYDGLCTKCRGRTAYEQKIRDGLICEVPE